MRKPSHPPRWFQLQKPTILAAAAQSQLPLRRQLFGIQKYRSTQDRCQTCAPTDTRDDAKEHPEHHQLLVLTAEQ
jgi:hypothetical protein